MKRPEVPGPPPSRVPESDSSRTTPVLSSLSSSPRGEEAGEHEPRPRRGPPLAAGVVLAERYRIRRLLGRGGMGEVYEAEDLTLGQRVALKFLAPGLEKDDIRRQRFLQEVTLARRVSHPNVCRVYDVGEAEGRLFLSMELIDGEDLSTRLAASGRPPYETALGLGLDLCRGLAAAHEQGILHRDLKPSNLMLATGGTPARRGRLRITDFGLARLTESLDERDVRSGTPAYMAPEQLLGQGVSEKSDLYSLGLVLYKLFTGRPAFPEASEQKPPARHWETMPEPPSRHVPEIEGVVERMILRCLEPDPRDRPSSALAVAAALASVQSAAEGAVLKTLLLLEVWPPVSGGDTPAEASLQGERLVAALLDEYEGIQLETAVPGSGIGLVQVLFDRPVQAVRCALACHQGLGELRLGRAPPLGARAAIHLGEVFLVGEEAQEHEVAAAAGGWLRELTGHLLALAEPGQTLMTRAAFDLARQHRVEGSASVRWLAHGSYEIAGLERALEVFEVGIEGLSPLTAPGESEQVRRRLVQETLSGWRPSPGLAPPQRPEWVLERKLNEGGFGEVWLAAHATRGERRVFKFCFDPERLKGLQREITLFRLLKETLGERDDIARIFDWNFDESPYFIESDYTEGGSLIEWTEERGGLARVPLPTRLEILAQVAVALAAAHSVGVLHKDVKPANVLITSDENGLARARLSDFGIGRVIERQRLDEAGITLLGFTETVPGTTLPTAHQSGTRLYMAPEILEGKPATVQADIYALGVMLYQLVVGDLSRALAPGWEREVDDPLLTEDIAAVVDGSPDRRLGNALRLAERLRALSRRRREREEAQRLRLQAIRSQKRRRLVGAATLILALLAVVTFFQARRTAREAEVSRQVTAFLVGLFEEPDPDRAQGETPTAREIFDRGAGRIRKDLAAQPEVQARLMQTIGTVYSNLGLYPEARSMLEEALAIRGRIHGEGSLEVAETLTTLAGVMNSSGASAEALLTARRAVDIRRRRLGDHHLDVASSISVLGNATYLQGDRAGAEALFREALEIRREHLGPRNPVVADSMFDVGTAMMSFPAKYAEAERLLRESLAIRRERLGDLHPAISSHLNNLAILLRQQGRHAEAELLLRESVALHEKIQGPDHPFVASSLIQLALVVEPQGRGEEAISLLRQALAIQLRRFGRDHPYLVITRLQLARILIRENHCEEAESVLAVVLETLRRDDSPDAAGHWRIRLAEGLYEVCRFRLGDPEASEATLAAACETVRRKMRDEPLFGPLLRKALIDLYASQGRQGEVGEVCPLPGSENGDTKASP